MDKLNPDQNAFRSDLADERLQGRVEAAKFVSPTRGVVVKGEVPLYGATDPLSRIGTYLRYGEEVDIFEDRGHVYWVQSTIDHYVGYAESKFIQRIVDPKSRNGSELLTVSNLISYVFEQPDMKTGPVDYLPRLAKVRKLGVSVFTRGTPYIEISRGRYVVETTLSANSALETDIYAAAKCYLGAPYRWAGKSFFGLDCSALVQNSYHSVGLECPRDTYMQKEFFPQRAFKSVLDAAVGDLLYFDNHAVIIGPGGSCIHADGGNMQVIELGLEELVGKRDLDKKEVTICAPGAPVQAR